MRSDSAHELCLEQGNGDASRGADLLLAALSLSAHERALWSDSDVLRVNAARANVAEVRAAIAEVEQEADSVRVAYEAASLSIDALCVAVADAELEREEARARATDVATLSPALVASISARHAAAADAAMRRVAAERSALTAEAEEVSFAAVEQA